MVYRGLLQSILIEALDDHRWVALILTGAIFMSVHTGSVAWQALPALWAFGILLGWVYERTGSLLPCILIHAVFNAWNVGYVLFFVPPASG
jgi:membrane protease YdiL (CAAX protease family)